MRSTAICHSIRRGRQVSTACGSGRVLGAADPPATAGGTDFESRATRYRFFIAALLALLLCAGGGGTLAQKDGDGSERWLLVEVRDEQGQPLKRACVTVVPREGEIIFRNADSRGRVKVKKLAAGRYRVTAKSDGYELQGKEITVGSENERVAFVLQPRAN